MASDPTKPAGLRGDWTSDRAACSAYSEGAGPYRVVPAAVAIPADREDLVTLVRHAGEQGTALVPRGAGSGMPGGNVGRGVVLDLQRLTRPFFVSERGSATVGAAVGWASLNEAAAAHGLRLPPDPSSGAFCTVGGMAATNAAGARSLRYGSIRPWVRGLELVTADGQCTWFARGAPDRSVACAGHALPEGALPACVQRFERTAAGAIERAADAVRRRFPATRKNSAGYALDAYLESGDLVDLVIGSEGTLGVITRIELELARAPGAVTGLLLGVAKLAQLGVVVERLLEHDPSALELLDSSYLEVAGERAKLPEADVAAVLLVDFERRDGESARSAARGAAAAAADLCVFSESALTPEEHGRLWELRHAASPALAGLPDTQRSLQIVEDGCVPVAALGDYLLSVRAAAQELDVGIVAFGHAGDGHLHVNALVDVTEPGFEERLQALFERVTERLVALGGTTSGEHGDGRLRAGVLERVYGAEVVELFRHVKSAFDPDGIMNPGVILPDPETPPFGDLKVGPAAAAIPEGVARGLREMERTGGWGTPKLDLLHPQEER